ncbi:MAG: thioredoxin domain-containing protein [Bacteriovoracaceae bacterium]
MSQNKLHTEKSLYLKQHAENPINWWAYGEQPFKIAREQNKLIFLSIGYSSCHWCHVMAHESFEDETTAKILNDYFVCIKIDREEYPDLDHYYQTAASIMTGKSGWPLSIFLTPEGKPFFAGTYFPKEAKQGLPSFKEILNHLHNLYKENKTQIDQNADQLLEEIQRPHQIEKKIEFNGHFPPPSAIMNALKNYADEKNGGYGQAPKFPHFAFYEWACEQILEGMIPKEQGQHIVNSIERMMMGGLYDHVKGGIHRYSTDEKFMVPHFEKMLYDQAGLLKVLSKLSQFYPSPLVFDGILQTIDYLKTEMVADEGFFFSAQDADSEGTEGLYFTFSKEEFEQSFEDAPPEQKIRAEQFLKVFNITEKGNFEHGLNVISLNPELKNEYYSQDGWQEVRDIRRRLLEQRKLRMPPATDRKGIAAWNYMLLSALTDVIQYCPVDVIQNEALQLIQQTVEGCLAQFITLEQKTQKHILKHTNTLEGQALYLEDYVNFTDAQLRLFEITGNEVFKKNANETIDFIIQGFIKDGIIYSTALGSSTLGVQNLPSPLFDQSYRSSSMTLIHLLERMSVFRPELSAENIFGEKYQEFAQFTLINPLGHGEGLRALTYPSHIFRRIEVPRSWIENLEFRELRSHFFSRFVMDYHSRDNETFQICNKKECEHQGKGFAEFKKLFTQKDQQDA